ncbi:MAG TPA: cyclic nucleotide-binding domain-containing protein [Rhodocyclaceae bacterium]
MPPDVASIIDGLDLFQDFSYPELRVIARYLTKVDKKKGEVVFAEGDPGDHMVIVAEGKLSVFKGGEHGAQLLCHEGRGRIVGEMALLDRERRSATCVADSDCMLLVLSGENMGRLAADTPLLAYRFMLNLAKLMSRRLRRTSGMLVEYLVA